MLMMSTSLLHEKNNFASQFFVIISYYRFTYEIHKRLYCNMDNERKLSRQGESAIS